MKIHRLAKYFPPLEGEEFDLFVADIKANGQQESIMMIGDEILDGVNRWRACKKLGIEPKTRQYDGDNPLAFVISENIRRRHLNEGQRGLLATEMLPEFEKQAAERKKEGRIRGGEVKAGRAPKGDQAYRKHGAADDAAKAFNVGGRTVQRAKRVKAKAPGKITDIMKGKITLGAVDDEIREAESTKRAIERAEKEGKAIPKQHPKAVKDYLNASSVYVKALQLAIKCKAQDMFAPESIQFVKNRHEQIRELMTELEGE